MLPASAEGQFVLSANLEILPVSSQHSYVDYWGSRVSSFEVLTPHSALTLTATSLVEVRPRAHDDSCLPWDDLGGRAWALADRLGGERFERDGDEIAREGLYVQLAGWGSHFLAWEANG